MRAPDRGLRSVGATRRRLFFETSSKFEDERYRLCVWKRVSAMEKPVHQIIEENADRIIERFAGAVCEAELPSRNMSHAEIVDKLGRFLAVMAATIKAGRRDDARASIDAATEHGRQRWHEGYDLKSVVREYGLIRQIVLEVLEANSDEPRTMQELEGLTRFLQASVADAAVEFATLAERQVREALSEAQRATRAREDVVSIVSHDLKNPLDVIHGNVQLLLRQLDTGDPPSNDGRLRKRFDAMMRATDRMSELIGGMLDLARLNAGELTLTMQNAHGCALLSDTCDHLSTLAEQRSVRLVVVIEDDFVCHCDAGRISQALQNVASNAIKYTPIGGTVTLRLVCSKAECTFEVIDAGPGIPQDQIPHLFDRFCRSSDAARGGTGLGLAIAKSLVELHGGRISVESKLGQGSTFRLSLPRG